MGFCSRCDCWQFAPCVAHGRMSECGQPFWHTLLPEGKPVALGSGTEVSGVVDTVIIGCGLTGASCAYALSQLGGGSVLVLEARGIGDGATGRNGGHQWPAAEYTDESYASAMGRLEHADAAAVRHLVSELPQEDRESIELHVTGGAALTFDPEQEPFYEAENGEGLKYFNKEALAREGASHAAGVVGGTLNQTAAQLVPARLVLALIKLAQQKGVRFVTGQKVTKIEPNNGGWKVSTDQNSVVQCAHVVHATNGYERSLLPERITRHMKYVRGQVVAIPSVPVAPRSISYESVTNVGFSDRYLIQRQRDGVVVLGGCRYVSPSLGWDSDDSVVEACVHAKLLESYNTLFGDSQGAIPVPSHAWAGTMCFTDDGRPCVGTIRERPEQYVAVGYCGHGMVRAFSCGRHIAELIHRAPVSHSDISKYFNADRFA